METPEAVSWEHLVKELVMFNLEKRRLGLGVGRRDMLSWFSERGWGEAHSFVLWRI